MRTVVAIAALSAGCFSPKYPEGLTCGAGREPCPPGQFCDFVSNKCVSQSGGGDAGVDGLPDDDDDDNDGKLDFEDNCPDHPNFDQADEDVDMIGNVCDPCPISADNFDADGDGVGDFCDPRPDSFGDTIALFEGFDGDLPGTWSQEGTTWTIAGGVARYEFDIAGNPGWLVTDVLIATDGVVAAQVLVEQTNADPMMAGREASVGRFATIVGQGVACALVENISTASNYLAIVDSDTSAELGTNTAATWAPNTPYVLADRQIGATHGCSKTPSGEFATATYTPTAEPYVTLRMRNMTGHFAWVMYIETPP